MDFDVTDHGDGTYTVSTRGDSVGDGGFAVVCGIIAYILVIIGMILATVSTIEIPYALIIMIVLDIVVISPIILYPISRKTDKSMLGMVRSVLGFIGRYAYIAFAIMYAVLWILYFNKVEGAAYTTLFFFSMYGVYYFPYYMLMNAYKFKSMALSVVTLASIYCGAIAMVIAAYFKWDGYYPMFLTTVMALFALISGIVAKFYYKTHPLGKGALTLKKFFIILGGSLVAVAIVLACISSLR